MAAQRQRFYWCGWEVPNTVPEEHMVADWPSGMEGWINGEKASENPEDEDLVQWVGVVIATSSLHAWRTVLSCYGPSSQRIKRRWTPEVKPDNWAPTARYPGFSLKLPRQTETVAFEKPKVRSTDEK